MKILIIRFSSIGDIVLTSPIIRCIKQQLKAEIHYLTKKTFSFIIQNNRYADKVYAIEKDVFEVLPQLKKENYDFIVDLHHNLRSALIKMLLGKKSKSFHKLNIKKWLLVNFKVNCLPKKHVVDRYFETVKPLGIVNDGKGLDYFIPEADEVNIKTLPDCFHNGYVGFVIGAKHLTKQLPKEKIVSIIEKLNRPVILLGGKEDFEKGEKIISSTGQSLVFNACGKYNLNQSASLVKQAKTIITHDTGVMHIAAAFKKEIISVWGNTVPEFGMYPYYGDSEVRSHKAEVKNLSCRPCSKLGYRQCPKGHFRCMNKINEQEIADFLNE